MGLMGPWDSVQGPDGSYTTYPHFRFALAMPVQFIRRLCIVCSTIILRLEGGRLLDCHLAEVCALSSALL